MSDVELSRVKVVIEADKGPIKKELSALKKEMKETMDVANKKVEGPEVKMDKTLSSVRKVREQIDDVLKSVSIKKLNSSKLTEEIKKIRQAIRDGGSENRGEIKRTAFSELVKQAKLDSGILEYSDEYNRVSEDIERVSRALEKLQLKQRDLKSINANKNNLIWKQLKSDIRKTAEELKIYEEREAEFLIAKGADFDNPEWKALQKDISNTETRMERYRRKEQEMVRSGFDTDAQNWERTVNAIEKAKFALKGYEQEKQAIVNTGNDTQFTGTKLSSGSWLASAGAVAGSMKNAVSEKLAGIRQSITDTIKRIPVIGRVATESAYVASKAFGGMRAAMNKVTPVIKKVSGAFGALLHKIKNAIPGINRFGNSMRGVQKSGRGMGGLFKTIGMSAKFMLAGMLIRAPFKAMQAGMQNLAQYSDKTNGSLSMLMSSLTQLKNAFATAFAPILDVIAPILNFFIQKIITVVNAIGHFTAALTEQGSFIRAKKVNQDYAKSLGANASGAGKAEKANKKLQRTLMGFDQINKLDSNEDTDDPSGGGVSPKDMFETVQIDGGASDFAQKVKDAWQNADFTDIGRIVGEKINSALNSIPWDKIKETSGKIGRSIATFLNGGIEETDWNLVGQTIAEGLNTGFEFGYNFVTNFDWKRFGNSISEIINGTVSELDWKKAAVTVSEFCKGILDAVNEAIEETDWIQLGEKIKEYLANIDWTGITERIFELLGAALGALAGLAAVIGEVIAGAIIDAKNYFAGKIEECGGSIVLGILKGIWDGMVGIGEWIVDHIFTPFVNGFKKAFGIHSPSTVMQEQGGHIISGLLKGLKDNIVSVLKWIRDIPKRIKEALGNAKEWLKEKGSDAISGLVSGFENNKEKIREAASKIPGLISKGIGNLWSIGRNAISNLIDGFKSLNIPTPHFETNGHFKIAGFDTPIPKFKVKWYAAGGFPDQGEMFVARENGPELVGRMGRKNAVANNGQIVEGIKAGVFEAVLDAFQASGILDGNASGKDVVLEFTLYADSEKAYRFVRKGKQKYDGRYFVTDSI